MYIPFKTANPMLCKREPVGFIVGFIDTAARDRYLHDEEQQKTGARIVAAASGGLDGILVYDLEVLDRS